MKRMFAVLILVVSLVVVSVGNASAIEAVTWGKLKNMDQRIVSHYIVGVLEGTDTLVTLNYPRSLTNGQLIADLKRYLANTPSLWNRPLSSVIVNYVVNTYRPWKPNPMLCK